ncbi:MAG: TldD/PmbA family protein [Nitrospira sp.]|uniref:TldE/PmbA family protein, Actinobacterial subgroup n=1 Tax=Nitrospira defluvii TaxID=330214 RepID=A0ABM8QRU5_9BACT|nr:TldD/PmbA family protein [Nitrospira defluvii]MCS6328632.1 TldD/PmbA family protein [Nitrospira sp.]CAE6711936.1 TldE/PmbA family protein, Actinobacterial subgroup [Nitrospira defluvii]
MTSSITASWPKLTSRQEFEFLADLVMGHSTGDETFLSLRDSHGGTTRFANNQVIQNVNQRRGSLSITVAFGHRHGTASTTDFTAGAVRETLKQAESIARLSPDDPEYLPPVGPQTYLSLPTSRPETSAAGPARRLDYAREAIGQCKMENLNAAGTVSSGVATIGLAAGTGLRAYEERTEARFSLTVQAGDATGWSAAAHRSIDRLHIQERTLAAIIKAKRGADEPQELPPGRYTVILEPAAVAGLLSWMIWMLDAKSFYKGTSPFSGKLGSRIIDRRLSLLNQPAHTDLLGHGFTHEGLPVIESGWIESGVLTQLLHDRYTAREHQIDPLATLESPHFSGERPIGTRVDDLIRTTQRGILVTNFWYIRPVNPSDLTLTGMTRDGTFLIENGEITSAIRNFRFHESPLRAFNQVDAYTTPAEAVTSETGKALVPAMRIHDFNFSSVTRF